MIFDIFRGRSRRLFVGITSNQESGSLEIIWKRHFWTCKLVSQHPPPTYPGLGDIFILDHNFGKCQGAGCSMKSTKASELAMIQNKNQELWENIK
jgi:hypothetical protein